MKQKAETPMERHELEGTPFCLYGNEEKGFKVLMGEYQVFPDTYKDLVEAEKATMIENLTWEKLMPVIGIYIHYAFGLIPKNLK